MQHDLRAACAILEQSPSGWPHVEERTPHEKQGFWDALSVCPPGTHPMSHTHLGLCTVLLGCLDCKSSISSQASYSQWATVCRSRYAFSIPGEPGQALCTGVFATGEDRRMTLWDLFPSGCAGRNPPPGCLQPMLIAPGALRIPGASSADSTAIYLSAYL